MSQSLKVPLQQRKPLRISTDLPLFVRSSSDSSGSSSPTNQNTTTPETTPSTGIPQCLFHVICMHDFESSDPDHLPFHKDEVLTIVKQEHSGWWAAMRPQGDRVGWIPSSFVSPLNRSMFLEHADETVALRPYEGFSDYPLSAGHDPWVPVSEECTALSFRLVTPTNLVLYKYFGFFDDRARNHNHELFSGLPNERTLNVEEICVPPTSQTPFPHRIQRPCPPSPLLLESAPSHPTRPAGPPQRDAALYHHPDPCRADGQSSLSCLTTPANSDDTNREFIPSSNIADPFVILKPSAVLQDGTDPDDRVDGQPQYLGLPTTFHSVGGTSDIRSLDLTFWVPDDLAKQLCVLAHTLYASIRQNECLDWIRGGRNTEVTGLRHFFETHDYIVSWVRKSILADDDTTRQAETLDFWIRVAEGCHSFRDFDSLCAIILALSRSSSIESAWSRCVHRQTFAMLRDMLDVTNKSYCLMDIMDAAKGPSVPFVRRYLEHISELHVEHSNKSPPHQSGHAGDACSLAAPCEMQLAAIATLLRHQSSPYGFKIVGLADGQSLARN